MEAHAFSTVDRNSLDVFVVDGWSYEENEQLRTALEKEQMKIEKQSWPNLVFSSPMGEQVKTSIKSELDHLEIPNDGIDVWEIDPQLQNLRDFISFAGCCNTDLMALLLFI
ncbi:serine/threonine-protein kinase STY46-like isoform X2 [Actinidia eriantha]|uniref:serine/threonine-protein kinase STY46-like isoform X2 n=1 Tax=Actinidia eriantha TaxID=165200 RepID=UPI0025906EE6|nr:serine/threonine-protein kinase STY46-like isoform X2 [Actinidia eriantha]